MLYAPGGSLAATFLEALLIPVAGSCECDRDFDGSDPESPPSLTGLLWGKLCVDCD